MHLDPLASRAAGSRPVRRLALAVRALCLLGAASLLVFPALFWSQPDWVELVVRQHWGHGGAALQLDAGARWRAFAASMLAGLVSLAALWQLWRLFGCYGRGELLSPRPAQHLHRLGLALMALALTMPLSQTLVMLALTWGNPPGQRQLVFALSSQHFLALLSGLVLLAQALVMREAARVADENEGFV